MGWIISDLRFSRWFDWLWVWSIEKLPTSTAHTPARCATHSNTSLRGFFSLTFWNFQKFNTNEFFNFAKGGRFFLAKIPTLTVTSHYFDFSKYPKTHATIDKQTFSFFSSFELTSLFQSHRLSKGPGVTKSALRHCDEMQHKKFKPKPFSFVERQPPTRWSLEEKRNKTWLRNPILCNSWNSCRYSIRSFDNAVIGQRMCGWSGGGRHSSKNLVYGKLFRLFSRGEIRIWKS